MSEDPFVGHPISQIKMRSVKVQKRFQRTPIGSIIDPSKSSSLRQQLLQADNRDYTG